MLRRLTSTDLFANKSWTISISPFSTAACNAVLFKIKIQTSLK